jgi:hypothetical protein
MGFLLGDAKNIPIGYACDANNRLTPNKNTDKINKTSTLSTTGVKSQSEKNDKDRPGYNRRATVRFHFPIVM